MKTNEQNEDLADAVTVPRPIIVAIKFLLWMDEWKDVTINHMPTGKYVEEVAEMTGSCYTVMEHYDPKLYDIPSCCQKMN